MAFELTAADWILFAAFLLVALGVGVWAGRGRLQGDDFLAAGRPTPSALLGLGLAVAGPVALYYAAAPVEVYSAGMRFLLAPLLALVALPMLFWCLVPLYHNLEPDSVFEYLELRFNLTARTAATVVFLVWQLAWLATMLVLPCKLLHLGGATSPQALLVIVGTGLVVSLYTARGGANATTWVDALKWPVMAAAMIVVVLAVREPFGDQVGRIWSEARSLDRTTVVDGTWSWSSNWSAWSAAPALVLLPLFFFTADPATVGRLMSARDYRAMNAAILGGAVLWLLVLLVAIYAGLGLLSLYHAYAQEEMRPNWVVHSAVDPETGRPLIDDQTVIDADTIDDLIARGAILDPNTGRPVEDTKRLVGPDGQVLIEQLATWDSRPRSDGQRGRIWEPRLRQGSDELFGWFVHRHVAAPLVGLVLAGLVAAAMAALDAGLASLAGVLVIDFHRRRGWAEKWLARRLGKSPDELNEVDELHLARPLVCIFGALAALLAVAAVEIDDLFGFMVLSVSLAAAPLLGLFLLGLFTRRTTAPAAVGALAVGCIVTLWLVLGHYAAGSKALGWAYPWSAPLGIFWPLPLGLAATLVAGFALSFFVGRRKNRVELTGLVLGLGTWGAIVDTEADAATGRRSEEEIYWIDGEEEEKGPWR